MGSVYTQTFWCDGIAGAGGNFTCRDGYRTVIRDVIVCHSTDALPISFTLARTSPTPVNLLELVILSSANPPMTHWEGRLVLEAGWVIHLGADALCDVTVQGYELALP